MRQPGSPLNFIPALRLAVFAVLGASPVFACACRGPAESSSTPTAEVTSATTAPSTPSLEASTAPLVDANEPLPIQQHDLPKVTHPCPKGVHRCVFLLEESYVWAWGYNHSVWLMDTTGAELEWSSSDPKTDRWRGKGDAMTPAELAELAATARRRPRTVPASEVERALSLLAASTTGSIRSRGDSGCRDGAGVELRGYLPDSDRTGLVPIQLRHHSCLHVDAENDSLAARELSAWVDRVRRQAPPAR